MSEHSQSFRANSLNINESNISKGKISSCYDSGITSILGMLSPRETFKLKVSELSNNQTELYSILTKSPTNININGCEMLALMYNSHLLIQVKSSSRIPISRNSFYLAEGQTYLIGLVEVILKRKKDKFYFETTYMNGSDEINQSYKLSKPRNFILEDNYRLMLASNNGEIKVETNCGLCKIQDLSDKRLLKKVIMSNCPFIVYQNDVITVNNKEFTFQIID